MKKLLILIATITIVYACSKKTAEPQQQVVTNNQTTTVACDTINCLQAAAQGTYTFAPNNGSDTIMTGCKVRMTFDGIKDSIPQYGGANNDSLMYYAYDYWYKMTPINFSNTTQTTNSFYNRLSCRKGSIFMAVTMYFKSGKRAIFHR